LALWTGVLLLLLLLMLLLLLLLLLLRGTKGTAHVYCVSIVLFMHKVCLHIKKDAKLRGKVHQKVLDDV
jgi:hypothetical protein